MTFMLTSKFYVLVDKRDSKHRTKLREGGEGDGRSEDFPSGIFFRLPRRPFIPPLQRVERKIEQIRGPDSEFNSTMLPDMIRL